MLGRERWMKTAWNAIRFIYDPSIVQSFVSEVVNIAAEKKDKGKERTRESNTSSSR